MAKFDTTGYLVVKITDPHKDKTIGRKCIPARWAENLLGHNYLIIRYPEEENIITTEQVKNKEPSIKTWPCYCALIMFRTDSYEKAIEFITENDKQDTPTAAGERPNNTMNETKACAIATPSTSGKRIHSEETYNNTSNEDTPPKRKRESAIRSGNNLKMLIQNKMLHYIPKQKVSPKKVLSLRKEARTETLETLISAGQFNKLDKLYSKSIAAKSHGSTVNDEAIVTDDSDSNHEPDKIPPLDRNILEPVPTNELNPTNKNITPGRSKTPLCETVIATVSNSEPDKIPPPERYLELVPRSELNPTYKNKTPGRSKTPLRETVIAADTSGSYNEPDKVPRPERYLEPVPTSELNPTYKNKTPGRSKTPLRETVIAADTSGSYNEPDKVPRPERYILEPVPTNDLNPTNKNNTPGRSKTPLREIVFATAASDINSKPDKIPPPDRYILEPVPTNELNATKKRKIPGRAKTPLRETVMALNGILSNNEPEGIPRPDRNRPEPVPQNEPNSTNTTINPGTSKTPLPEAVDSDPCEISSTNYLDQLEKTKIKVKGNQSSLNADILVLKSLIQNLAPENRTEHQIADIKHLKDIYNSILEVKSKMDAVYQEKSIQLKKSFASINLFVPEIKKGLSLPTIQQLKENNRPNNDEPKAVSSRKDQPPQRKRPSSHPRTPSLQQLELSSDSESFSQSPKSSISSKSKCIYFAKWTLKHQAPGRDLIELMPNSGIYVSEDELSRCKLLGTEMRNFSRLLLSLIFTNEALSKCSYTDKSRNRKHSRSEDKRPGLDEHARNVLLDYVYKHAKESKWTIVSREVMNQSLRDKLRKK